MKNKLKDLKIGDTIVYSFLYSNEETKIGIVTNIKKDINFYAMIYLLTDNEIDVVPFNIMEFRVLE